MERKLYDLDLPKLFLMLNKNLQAYENMVENFDELRRMVKQLVKPSSAELLHIKDVADLLNVTPNTIYRYVNSGQLTSIKIGNRHAFYKKHIQAFLDKNSKGNAFK